MDLPFAKMQGVGNDFVVVDGRGRAGVDWSAAAIRLCDRRFGVGADGLLVLDNSDKADFQMRMFNPDGSPDVCGNGLRCITRYAIEKGIVTGDTQQIETLIDVRTAMVNRDRQGDFKSVTVTMGQPQFASNAIPMIADTEPVIDFPLELADCSVLPITALSTGSTHSVTFVDALPDNAAFFAISPQVEHHARFPERTSLMWVVVESPTRLRMRIWERGAGETLGCGTGACAAAAAAIQHGFAAKTDTVTVASKGGELHIAWNREAGRDIEMTGPAEWVFEGVIRLETDDPISNQR